MITIRYPHSNSNIDNWRNQLEALVTSHELIEDTSIEIPILKDNSETVKGEKAIDEYIDSLLEFKKAWFCS
jgi:hypothetical protein